MHEQGRTRQTIIEGINFAAYKETDSSLYDSDKNRLFGSDHYNSWRRIVKPIEQQNHYDPRPATGSSP